MGKNRIESYCHVLEGYLGYCLESAGVVDIAGHEYTFDLLDDLNDVSIKIFHLDNVATFSEYEPLLDYEGIVFVVDAGDAFAHCDRCGRMCLHGLDDGLYHAAMLSQFILALGGLWIKTNEDDEPTDWGQLPLFKRRTLLEPWAWK
jgi:hypothetical protein